VFKTTLCIDEVKSPPFTRYFFFSKVEANCNLFVTLQDEAEVQFRIWARPGSAWDRAPAVPRN
jgi:hypothetical protein